MAYFPESQVLNLGVSQVGTSGAAVTATLPAVAGKYHYIAFLEITLYAAAAIAGAATPITVTTTNLPSTPAFTFPTALPIGTTAAKQLYSEALIQSSALGAATTVVCPATVGAIWRVNVLYFACP